MCVHVHVCVRVHACMHACMCLGGEGGEGEGEEGVLIYWQAQQRSADKKAIRQKSVDWSVCGSGVAMSPHKNIAGGLRESVRV